jgi:hypothetical protein
MGPGLPIVMTSNNRPAKSWVSDTLGDNIAGCLDDLFSLVMGECPSLLDELSGGDADMYMRIQETLSFRCRLRKS